MDVKYKAITEFNLKARIDMVRVFMGKAYGGFLVVAGAVLCYNYYLMSTGKALDGDAKKNTVLLIIMIAWGFIPVIVGFIWDKLSKVKRLEITVYADKLVCESENGSFELTPDGFCTVAEREHYIKLGTIKKLVIIDKNNVSVGDGDKLGKELTDMRNK